MTLSIRRLQADRSSPAVRSAITLTPFFLVTAAQLVLGCDPAVASLALLGAIFGLLPFCIAGLDLYTLLSIVFFARYTGIAMVVKTCMGQPLQTNLLDPLPSYGLVASLLFVVSTTCLLVRTSDRGKGFVREPAQDGQIQKIIVASAILGIIGTILNVGSASRISGITSTGALNQIGGVLKGMFLISIVAETWRSINSSAERRVFSPTLIGLLLIGFALAMGVNARESLLDCLIAVAVTMLLTGTFRLRYAAVGALFAFVFLSFVSPLMLASRQYKFGQTAGEYVSSTATLTADALTKRGYLKDIEDSHAAAARRDAQAGDGDYFGTQSNVFNRLSWIVLVDRIYDASLNHAKLGFTTIPEMTSQIAPRFLFPNKLVARYIYSDYLSYQMGLEEPGRFGALNFGLPAEGLVCFGLVGWLLYPMLGLALTLFLLSRMASFREPRIWGVYLFAVNQHGLFEWNADGFLGAAVRGIPTALVILLLLTQLTRTRSSRSARILMPRPHSDRFGIKIQSSTKAKSQVARP